MLRKCLSFYSFIVLGPISNLLLLCLPPDTLEKTRNLRPFKQFKRTLVNHSDQSTDTLPVLLTPVQCAVSYVLSIFNKFFE